MDLYRLMMNTNFSHFCLAKIYPQLGYNKLNMCCCGQNKENEKILAEHPRVRYPTKQNLTTNIYCNENVLQIFSNLEQVLHLQHFFLCYVHANRIFKRNTKPSLRARTKVKRTQTFYIKKIYIIAKGICNADYSILG